MKNKKHQLFPVENPIPELISDETYNTLKELGLLQPVYLRSYLVKRDWNFLKLEMDNMGEAVQVLCSKYNICESAVKKIIYIKFWYQENSKTQYLKIAKRRGSNSFALRNYRKSA